MTTPGPNLHEPTRRRPDFIGGAPVTLLDGQVWQLARPRVTYDVVATSYGPVLQTRWTLGDGPGPDADLNRLLLTTAVSDTVTSMFAFYTCVVVEIGILALRRNYRLSRRKCEALLEPTDPTDPAMFSTNQLAVFDALVHQPLSQMTRAAGRVARDLQKYSDTDPSIN